MIQFQKQKMDLVFNLKNLRELLIQNLKSIRKSTKSIELQKLHKCLVIQIQGRDLLINLLILLWRLLQSSKRRKRSKEERNRFLKHLLFKFQTQDEIKMVWLGTSQLLKGDNHQVSEAIIKFNPKLFNLSLKRRNRRCSTLQF